MIALRIAGIALSALLAVGCSESAARIAAPRKVAAGEVVPDAPLVDESGARTTLRAQIAPRGWTAIVAHHPDCPCAANCGRLVNELVAEGRDDFRVVGILADAPTNVRVREALAEQRRDGTIAFPVLLDESGDALRSLGATNTPEIWLVDSAGRVHYQGAPENSLFPGSPGHRRLLAEALDALRAGREPEPASWEPIGCEIGKAGE